MHRVAAAAAGQLGPGPPGAARRAGVEPHLARRSIQADPEGDGRLLDAGDPLQGQASALQRHLDRNLMMFNPYLNHTEPRFCDQELRTALGTDYSPPPQVDEEFLAIVYNFFIDALTGDISLAIPGYFQSNLGEF